MLSRADLIKRFRENKPTSREERKKDSDKIQLIFDNDYSDNTTSKVESSNRKLGETNNLDDLIEKEILQLKREVEDKDRQITAKLNLSSYDKKYSNKNKSSNEVRFTLSNEYNDSHLSLSPKSYRMLNNKDKERKKNDYSNIDMLRMSNNEGSLDDSTEFLRKYRDKSSSNNKNNYDYSISSGLYT